MNNENYLVFLHSIHGVNERFTFDRINAIKQTLLYILLMGTLYKSVCALMSLMNSWRKPRLDGCKIIKPTWSCWAERVRQKVRSFKGNQRFQNNVSFIIQVNSMLLSLQQQVGTLGEKIYYNFSYTTWIVLKLARRYWNQTCSFLAV